MRRAHFSARTRTLVMERAGGRCEARVEGVVCKGVSQELHHRRTRANGGTRDPEAAQPSNALAVCSHCHYRIGGGSHDVRRWGYYVIQSHRPVAAPVFIGDRWCLLLDDGGKTPLIPSLDGTWLFNTMAGYPYPPWLVDNAAPLDGPLVDVTASLEANLLKRWKGRAA